MSSDKVYDYSNSAMSPYQQARADALRVAASVLSASSGIFASKTPPKDGSTLLQVADWVLGEDRPDAALDALRTAAASGQVLEVRPQDVPSIFETLAKQWPDCGAEDCPIHTPSRGVQNVKPEDFGTPEKVDWVEDVAAPGDEVDQDVAPEAKSPVVDPKVHGFGNTFAKDGILWQVVMEGGELVWKSFGAVGEADDDTDDVDTRPIPVGEWTDEDEGEEIR